MMMRNYEKFEIYLYDFGDKNKTSRSKGMIKLCKEFIRMHEVG